MVYRRNLGRLGTSFQPTVQAITFPASVGGVNALDALLAMPPQDCIYTYNLMPVEYGLILRKGYREWATGCAEDPPRLDDTSVRTIVPYESQRRDVARDRLFAVTAEGIWDVTLFNTQQPVQDVVFPNVFDDSGYGVWTEFTNDSERHFLFYADAINGLHQYEEGVGWSIPSSGVLDTDWYYVDVDGTTRIPFPVEDIAFIMVHKLRIWVILEDRDDAWYLPLFSIAGELKKFTFGSKLIHGGNLMGLYTWTLDGGDGLDDYFIAVSRGGDIAVYRGGDPEANDWSLVGSWFIGEVPESRRLAAEYGSEMYILSTYGLTSLRDLLQGSVANDNRTSPSAKVNRFLRADVEGGKDRYEWSLRVHPADGFLQIITPDPSNTPYVQYNQNLSTKAWGFWRGVPIRSADTWNGDYFMGTADGTVLIYDGVLDGTSLSGPDLFTAGPSILPADRGWVQDAPGVPDYTFTEANNTGPNASMNIKQFEFSTTFQVYEITYTADCDDPTDVHGAIFGAFSTVNAPKNVGSGTFVDYVQCDLGGNDNFLFTTSGKGNMRITNVQLRLPPDVGQPVEFTTLTSFQAPDSHAQFKKSAIIRTIGVTSGAVAINVRAVYDYNLEQQAPPADTPVDEDVSRWNSAIWDASSWDFGLEGKSIPVGALGLGRALAISTDGSAANRISVVGWDFLYQRGGYL